MRLLQLNAVARVWQRCRECGHLCNPSVLGTLAGEAQANWHCFRCFHILHAVVLSDAEAKEVN